MGQKLSTRSISCIDCSSRLITIEDNEISPKYRTISSNLNAALEDLTDEITVFESPLKHASTKEEELYMTEIIQHFETAHENFTVPSISTELHETEVPIRRRGDKLKTLGMWQNRNSEEPINSEVLTPTLVLNSFRCKTYSSNYSPISVNLVDSIRKNSNDSSTRSEVTSELVTNSKRF